MSCNLHIDKAGLKANKTSFAIERNISNLNRVAKLNLFKSMIIPVILYVFWFKSVRNVQIEDDSAKSSKMDLR